MNSKAVGERVEGIILGHLSKLGKIVLLPFGNNQRYDMVTDNGDGTFTKGQCKNGLVRDGNMRFKSVSTNGFTGKNKDYTGTIDVFWVYCEELDKVYEIPVDIASKASYTRLRLTTPEKNIEVKWAKDYEI